MSLGLTHIRKSAEELHALGSDRHITLSASTAFASFWMLPRLPRFREDLPDIDLRIQTSDRDTDIVQEGVPLAIRGRQGRELGRLRRRRAGRGGDFHHRQPGLSGAGRHAGLGCRDRPTPLDPIWRSPSAPAPDWDDWFRSVGAPPPARAKGLSINDYVLVVQAVLGGQGIAPRLDLT